eukprot:CAMPEP_0178448966 /NCGR_PEP_ID=MMETSP0689_2-20121128/42279_1 /TAXON_ID=160604 /ORGANISM="Amphidinium massartii, Strain CS-259" /LENGTH=234 /DNA_ID=CAMNT_0020074213 /DNA_START=165 /DNA_END=866 /DNA_ORIENTATION=-
MNKIGSGFRYHILCYGDSLTCGFYNGGTAFEPYGHALQESLCAMGLDCTVSSVGLSGLTAAELAARSTSPAVIDTVGKCGKGLAKILEECSWWDLVVIMAGTNDIGKCFQAASIMHSVEQLHRVCHNSNVRTFALAAPYPTGWQTRREHFNSLLASWAKAQPRCASYVDPEDIIPRQEKELWEKDRLHFSPKGSIRLGHGLAPFIRSALLREIDEEDTNDDGEVESVVDSIDPV